jgi:hypothetical protein
MEDWGKWRLNLSMPMKNVLRGQEAFENHLAQFCAPIGWLPSLDAPTTKLKCKTGTCALIDTGEVKVFVTCEHVWSQWKIYKDLHPSAELLVGLDDGPVLIISNVTLTAFPDIGLQGFAPKLAKVGIASGGKPESRDLDSYFGKVIHSKTCCAASFGAVLRTLWSPRRMIL